MTLPLLASNFGGEFWIAIAGLAFAVLRWWVARQDARDAAAKANTEAEKAVAAQKAKEAADAQAFATQKGLDALALWIESKKQQQPPDKARETSASIRVFTEALPGAEAVVSEAVQRLGLSSKSRPVIATPKEGA